ncbi:hypothetical protein [Lactiplantibacillus fabifermentans]|uniref:DUF308 domain-containing protein n=2 Tax=Lactiplantibacillus fabifermentans TaxID=483011 RepID=W6TCC0_9LACO|nr:hypothetical protein [Lactiplantibacillus fabifermentans]ETY74125.1 hypothetical protein LFAB_08795 [Lactiplantibacillus fabifermentans T30PCM01]
MLFVAIIGLIVFLLAIFSVMYARQTGGGWKFLTFIAVLSLIVTGFATYKLPFWSFNKTASSESSSTATSTSASSSSAKLDSSSAVFNEGSQKKAAATTKLKEDSILKQLKTNYKDMGTITLDRTSKTFTVTPTNAKYVKSLKIIKKYPSKNTKAITTITDNLESLSTSLKKNLASGYTIRLLEPGTTDTTLISVKDGKVVTNNFK